METEIIRLPEVSRTTGLARSTIYLRIEQGLLPKPVSLGGKAVGCQHPKFLKSMLLG